MAGGWVRALQCKTNAIQDVSSSSSSASASFSPSLTLRCGNTSHHIKDIVHLSKPKPRKPKSSNSNSRFLPDTPTLLPPQNQRKQRTHKRGIVHNQSQRLSSFPTLVPLPPNHSSRKVVEMIFSSGWSCTSPVKPTTAFSGEIEMVFKVHNPSNKVEGFEEYRQKVQSCSGTEDSRCAADGNEMMRFHSAPASRARDVSKEPICWDGLIWPVSGDGAIRTFAGSGGAHDRVAGGGGSGGRWAMVVCRVIVGRICTVSKSGPNRAECESISVRKGELMVFDSRAVLPCFLIIYQI